MTTLAYSGTLTVVVCWCGMRHAVPSELNDLQRRQHRDGESVKAIYCPLGHESIPASARAFKGAATRARKRAGAGVCPCCKRSFKQLRQHMTAKHPEFAEAA